MTSKKQLLHDLLDIGGVATLNNLYEPTAKTYKGAMKRVRVNKDFWLKEGLIEVLKPYPSYRSDYPVREVFYGITKKGTRFIGREEDWKYKKTPKASNLENIIHESAKFDICLSFVRLFPDYKVTIDYSRKIESAQGNIIPDATVFLSPKNNLSKRHVIYVEIEKKKTISRTFSEKILKYKEILSQPDVVVLEPFTVFIVFFKSEGYDVFLRPQDMIGEHLKSCNRVREMVKELATREDYGGSMPNYLRYIAHCDFYRLNEPVCYKSNGKLVTPLE